MQKIADKLNRSRRLERLISFTSGRLANYRGAPILAGIVLIFFSLLIHLLAILSDGKGLYILGSLLLHIGLLSALIGILLAEPLGKS